MPNQPIAWPALAAQRTPVNRLPVAFQTSAFSTWPPSRGKPGIRLNTASTKLIRAKFKQRMVSGLVGANRPIADSKINRLKLTRGPAIATCIAPPGVLDSRSIAATPPNMNRVIEFTAMPCDRAAKL